MDGTRRFSTPRDRKRRETPRIRVHIVINRSEDNWIQSKFSHMLLLFTWQSNFMNKYSRRRRDGRLGLFAILADEPVPRAVMKCTAHNGTINNLLVITALCITAADVQWTATCSASTRPNLPTDIRTCGRTLACNEFCQVNVHARRFSSRHNDMYAYGSEALI